MGTIIQKLEYTLASVDDIQDAINEKGVDCQDTVPLGEYGDKIRQISSYKKITFAPWFDFNIIIYPFDENNIEVVDFDLAPCDLFDNKNTCDLSAVIEPLKESDIQIMSFDLTKDDLFDNKNIFDFGTLSSNFNINDVQATTIHDVTSTY